MSIFFISYGSHYYLFSFIGIYFALILSLVESVVTQLSLSNIAT